MASYLDFEKSIKQIDDDIANAKIRGDEHAVEILKKNLEKEISKTYKNLNEFQRLGLARHPDRPYTLDYVRALLTDSYEIHGDRAFKDDPSIVCFSGYIGGKRVIVIGEQKGRGTKYKIMRNFGMPHPEGYRKALRIAKLAEKFEIPIIFLIDTPGAYPGVGAEERGQSEAIARNLFEFSNLRTRTIAIVIGEGGSGGALAIGVADRLAMMKNSVFSVISPEGCAAILWNDPTKCEAATKAMKITADDLKELNLIDAVIEEPIMGAHRDKDGAIKAIGAYILKELEELEKLSIEEVLDQRVKKILSIGAYSE
ncbi:acetyl-CoA carboxylase carboxyltransferase subunit alpha [Campylobacter hyointestinalis]|uniref:Acetyl-coenzyme A carboxylase carboxyl transferase subunit alpha n=1 Tax=Campylobacter hyointestinalis subsp. hyointestinalis TaxID=91352 RepID=A0A855MZW3_CAMHY|nr:acetyl-CoA carboxylase carboxyl transferase subunit alpha [Campylobacter hyointestinalis]ANE32986.1 acetyl-CoA carboxylase, carboxyltransferase, alpha subunit [Campylobacter hyointestinalis subsp. hyointestinalis LMG 9260]KEA43989.1 acetyl-CoA carboxylase subunit alpha [Campylobacter hyointestinalis subsp. hyointestinalis]MBT0611791.1 acetyl-CoA carboxylase carboxyl transferase subunit alpha [Campylobacter hyointestinalis subsp. hyointestinalis]MDL2347349.1 acetyl-CoA carboxylase carboxyl tr